MRRIGLIGGTFDPIHQGHVRPVQAVCTGLELDRVIYLPTARPPHKPGRKFAPAWARYAMVELAVLHDERLWVSDFEMGLGKAAYTIDTLEHFAGAWPEAEIHYLLGSDGFAQLQTWKRWRELTGLARFVVMARPGELGGSASRSLPEEIEELLRSDRVQVFENAPEEVSATSLRDRLANGAAVPQDAMSPLVLEYIRKYKLYQ